MSEDKKTSRGESAARWWAALREPGGEGADPGALARLRRETSPAAAWGEAVVADLYRKLGYSAREREFRMAPVALVAMVLAHVREDEGFLLGEALGPPKPDASGQKKPAVMHPLRLRRLASARDESETLRGFREAVSLLKDKAPVADLAACILDWNDARRGERVRSRFLFAYHGAGSAAPAEEPADHDALSNGKETP